MACGTPRGSCVIVCNDRIFSCSRRDAVNIIHHSGIDLFHGALGLRLETSTKADFALASLFVVVLVVFVSLAGA